MRAALADLTLIPPTTAQAIALMREQQQQAGCGSSCTSPTVGSHCYYAGNIFNMDGAGVRGGATKNYAAYGALRMHAVPCRADSAATVGAFAASTVMRTALTTCLRWLLLFQ